MSQLGNLPHIYYTVSELSVVKDVTLLKNLNIKTLAFINEDMAYDIKFENDTYNKGDISVKLDTTNTSHDVSGIKPFIIFGMLYSLNQRPVISAKIIKQFEGDYHKLVLYHNQSLLIRTRSVYFENLSELDINNK